MLPLRLSLFLALLLALQLLVALSSLVLLPAVLLARLLVLIAHHILRTSALRGLAAIASWA